MAVRVDSYTDTTLTISWDAVPGATDYILTAYIRSAGNFRSSRLGNVTTFTFTGLDSETFYFGRLQALGGGAPVLGFFFQYLYADEIPATPTALYTVSRATGDNRSIKLFWTPVENAEHYQLKMSTDTNWNDIDARAIPDDLPLFDIRDHIFLVSDYVFENLNEGTEYVLQMRSVNPTGMSQVAQIVAITVGDAGDEPGPVVTSTGSLMVERYAPDAPDTVKRKAAERIDNYLAKTYSRVEQGRSAPPGVLAKSGAASMLYLWRNPRGGTISAPSD